MTRAGIKMKLLANGTINSIGYKMKQLVNGITRTGNRNRVQKLK